jgi:hypothetical protein
VLLTALALLELAVRRNRYQGYSNLLMNNRAAKAKSTIYTSAWGDVQRYTVRCIFESTDCTSPFTWFPSLSSIYVLYYNLLAASC